MKVPVACQHCPSTLTVFVDHPGPYELQCQDCNGRLLFTVTVTVNYIKTAKAV